MLQKVLDETCTVLYSKAYAACQEPTIIKSASAWTMLASMPEARRAQARDAAAPCCCRVGSVYSAAAAAQQHDREAGQPGGRAALFGEALHVHHTCA